MSTNHSVGRIAATEEKGRSTSTQDKVRSAFKPKKDRSPNLCTFTFADGRQCRTPRCSGHLHFCYFHAQKEAASLAAQQVGQDISRFLPAKLLTACDLGVAMSRLFCAVARGEIKPKVASTLAYLAQTMLQSIPIAQDEYIHSFDTDTWRSAVRASFRFKDSDDSKETGDTKDAPAPAPKTSPQPTASAPAPTAKPASSPAPQPSAQPAPAPHTPLPRTSAEFAQRVLAGRNSSPLEVPTPPAPGPETAPSPTSSSTNQTQPTPAPQSTSPHQSQPTQNQQHNSQPAPTPPAPSSVPPGFGAPANWDVLIPPKPRRRFSRHWHLPE
jgi:hypothetical protein